MNRPIRKLAEQVVWIIRKPLWQWLLTAMGVTAFAAMLAVLLIEWMVGCGETYVDANGVRHQHECVFIPQPKE